MLLLRLFPSITKSLDADLVGVAVGSLSLAAGAKNNVDKALVVLNAALAAAWKNENRK